MTTTFTIFVKKSVVKNEFFLMYALIHFIWCKVRIRIFAMVSALLCCSMSIDRFSDFIKVKWMDLYA